MRRPLYRKDEAPVSCKGDSGTDPYGPERRTGLMVVLESNFRLLGDFFPWGRLSSLAIRENFRELL